MGLWFHKDRMGASQAKVLKPSKLSVPLTGKISIVYALYVWYNFTMKHSIQSLRENMALDSETGNVYWVKTKSGRNIKEPIGHIDNEGYLRVIFDGTRYRLHRLVWILHNGQPIEDGCQIDHINGCRTDNRIANLRVVTSRGNNMNRLTHRSGRLVGAHFHKASGRWTSSIRLNGKPKSLGYYDTEVDAHNAYIEALTNGN
jgi:hypothetical protein